MYDPVTGRYTQPDPLGFVDGPSIYAYAGSSPFVYVDRDGLQVIVVPGPRRSTPPGPFGLPGPFNNDDPFTCPGGAVVCPQPTNPIDDLVYGIGELGSSIYGMCKRALSYGGNKDEDDCDKQLQSEQKFCVRRKEETALPDMYAACMARAMERYAACLRGKSGPKRWSKADEEVWINPER
jgi:hypothetical protein